MARPPAHAHPPRVWPREGEKWCPHGFRFSQRIKIVAPSNRLPRLAAAGTRALMADLAAFRLNCGGHGPECPSLTKINARPLRPAILSNVRAGHSQKPREEGGCDHPLKLGPELSLAAPPGATAFAPSSRAVRPPRTHCLSTSLPRVLEPPSTQAPPSIRSSAT